MIFHMLSPGSLAAFSAAVSQAGFGQPRSVQGVRAVSGEQVQQTAPAAPRPLPPRDVEGGVTPARTLPRGSLLDLSI